jgi:hypothetical protein
MSVREAVRAKRGKRSDQGAVWDSVDVAARKFAASSSTSSYDEILDQAAPRFESLTSELRPIEGQRGVLVGIGGRPRALDLFDRSSTLSSYWPSLIGGYASDAVGEPERPTVVTDAQAFLDRVLTAAFKAADAVGLGQESHGGSGDLVASALRWDGSTVHLAAFSAA